MEMPVSWTSYGQQRQRSQCHNQELLLQYKQQLLLIRSGTFRPVLGQVFMLHSACDKPTGAWQI